MNIQQLQYFSSVYETLNYSHSAEALFVSRQALRHTIHTIEVELKKPLFSNHQNKIRATPAADLLYKESREAVRGFDELERAIEAIKTQTETTLRFGLLPSFNDCLNPEELSFMQDSKLNWHDASANVVYTSGSCFQLRKSILDGTLDCASLITVWPPRKQFDHVVIKTGTLHLVVHKDNPLAQKKVVTISDLHGQRLATQGEGFDIHDFIANRCAKAGFKPDIAFIAQGLADLASLVGSGGMATYTFRSDPNNLVAPKTVCMPFAEPFMAWYAVTISKKGALQGESLINRNFGCKEDLIDLINQN
jgi:DNA-binding transcriptional LysR family regulator